MDSISGVIVCMFTLSVVDYICIMDSSPGLGQTQDYIVLVLDEH